MGSEFYFKLAASAVWPGFESTSKSFLGVLRLRNILQLQNVTHRTGNCLSHEDLCLVSLVLDVFLKAWKPLTNSEP